MSIESLVIEPNSDRAVSDVFEWDVSSWSRALEFWASAVPVNCNGKSVLELGARNGGLSLHFALAGGTVVCSDFGGPSTIARELHAKYGVSGRVSYADLDATRIEVEDAKFDMVVFKSILGGIGKGGDFEAQGRTIDEIYRVLKPGGALLFAENLAGSRLHGFLRRKFVTWSSNWNYLDASRLTDTFAQFDGFRFETWGFLATMGRSELQRRCLYQIDRLLVPMVPWHSRYIVFGVGHKPME